MMLAHRVIPTLLARGERLVKGERFDSTRVIGHVQQAVEVHQSRSVDELIILDIEATAKKTHPDLGFIARLTQRCFMPVTVGGGISSCEDIRNLLMAGADKVAICTAAVERPSFIREAAHRFGSQAIVVAIDAIPESDGDRWCVATHNGQIKPFVDAIQFAELMQSFGAGEILLTAVMRDGTLEGYDLDLIRAVASRLSIPLIANGGAGSYSHMADALKAGADAVAAGALWAWTDCTPREAALYLSKQGMETRT